MPLDGLRTSLIVDPANGMLPPLLPAAQARIADRPKRSFDDPETFGLAERCLLGNFGASGGSLASPPMVPSEVIPSYYQIVQTDTHVLIFTEWMHDARIVRLNGTHLPPAIRKWLGRFDRPLRRRRRSSSTRRTSAAIRTTSIPASASTSSSASRASMPKTLRYRVTVEDPDTWATPWTAEWPFKAIERRLFSVDCHEGNYAIENFLRGARAEERRARPPNR